MKLQAFLSLALLAAMSANGQSLMRGIEGRPVRLLPSDAAILAGPESRADLPCMVHSIKPELGLDLGFHSGYDVTLSLHDLAGAGDHLTSIMRVTPEGNPEGVLYFSQKWTVPPIQDSARGETALHGGIVLGEGKYQVDWLLRDNAERFCSARWQVTAEIRKKEKDIKLRLLPGAAVAENDDPFLNESPAKSDAAHSLKVVVLLHVAPQAMGEAQMRRTEVFALLSILRSIAAEPRIGTYSIAAFNLDRSEVLYRRENISQLNFPELGQAIQQLQLGTVNIQKLRGREDGEGFLSHLLDEEMNNNHPDALIFVGPKTIGGAVPLRGALKEAGQPRCPVVYLNYDSDPNLSPWRDLIGTAVKLWKGFEYTITKPRDLFPAWTEVMSRIEIPKTQVRTTAVNSLISK